MPAEPSGSSTEFRVGRTRQVAVQGEVARVGRADHVEVQVQRNVFQFFHIERLHVVVGSDQPLFLAAEEREPHRVVNRRSAPHRQCGLQHGRDSRTVVVDTGPQADTVQVRTHQHDILRRPGGGLSDDVLGAHMLGAGVDDESRVARSGSKLRTVGLADTAHRNRDVIVLQQRRAERLLLDVVGDDQSRRAASGRSGGLIGEVTATAVDQDHRARDRQAVVVGGLTARSVARRRPRRAGR